MTTTFTVSARSFLAAGVTVAALGSVAVTPLPAATSAAVSMPALVSPAVALAAAVQPLQQAAAATAADVTAAASTAGDAIINGYNALQPWVAYGFQLAQWAVSWVPGLWFVAPAIDLAYYTWQPVGEALVYSFAYLLDGQPELIPPTISQGIQNSASNFVTYAVNWVYSIVPFPPLPPIPIFNGFAAASTPPAAAGRGLAAPAASVTPAAVTPAAVTSAESTAPDVAPVIEALAPSAPARVRTAAPRAARAVAPAAARATASAAATAAAKDADAVAPVRAARSARAAQHESRR